MKILAALATGLIAAGIAPALADDDRPPTPEERTKIEEVLTNEGFTAWKEIEFDDNRWEIDDATHSDGKVYDLYLKADDLSILLKTPDD